MGNPSVLIAGAHQQTGYATARSLANLDLQLIGLSSHRNSRFCRSRLWDQLVLVEESMEAYLDKLVVLGKSSTQRMVLFAAQDDIVQLMSDNREELAKYYRFVLPERAVVDLLMDKTMFHQWAVEHGLPVPESHIVESESELDYVVRNIEFPVILKPLFRTKEWLERCGGRKVLKLNDEAEARNIDFDVLEAAPRLLIQRWIPGGDGDVHFCLTYVDRTGRELGHYTGRKVLQWPTLTGSTAIGVGTTNPEIHELTKDVWLKAGFRGLGSLEVKQSDQDGRYYITEPTVGRNNYQSCLAVAGGVNLTQIALYDAINDQAGKIRPREVFPVGTEKTIWIDEDFTTKVIGESGLRTILKCKNMMKAIGHKISFSHLSLNDPIPFLLFWINWLPEPVRRPVRRVIHRLTPIQS